jgi:predicted nicotinamide N-methyase
MSITDRQPAWPRSLADYPLPGGWTQRTLPIGRQTFVLRVPANPDAVLDCLEAAHPTAQPHYVDPYWARLWPAAEHLARAVIECPPSAAPRVLELGCGSGLVGIAALAAGRQVTFSDYVPLAVELALENARANGFVHAQGMILDWRQPHAAQYDWIVGADLLYDRQNLGPLLTLLDHMLAPTGQAWFGDAGRSPAGEFVQAASARGWLVTLYDVAGKAVLTPSLGSYQRIVLRRSGADATQAGYEPSARA